MTIISILIAFTLCHFVRELHKFRRFEWVAAFTRYGNEKLAFLPGWSGPGGFLILIGAPLLVVYLVNVVMFGLLGQMGSFLLSIAILVYTFGPRDLDVDVRRVIQEEDEEQKMRALETLLGSAVPESPDECQVSAIDAVFNKAMKRWFGIIFWFAVLGIFGAVLYRLAVWMDGGNVELLDDQKNLVTRLRKVLEWPVAQLMTLTLAIATDFDSVFRAWKKYHDERGHGLFDGNNDFMLCSARTIVMSGHAANDGYADQLLGPMASIKLSMDLVWRSLGVWATVLALLLLVDVIA
jgi:membrane protein required for beta-lactamase induction